jgi:hypothetical protein
MPSESIVFQPEISERDLDREVSDVNRSLADAASDIPANFDADMPEVGGSGGVGGGRLAQGMFALAEQRNEILADLVETMDEDFIGSSDGSGGGGGGAVGVLKTISKSGALAASGAGLLEGLFVGGVAQRDSERGPSPPPETPPSEVQLSGILRAVDRIENAEWPDIPSFPELPELPDFSSLEWPDMPDVPSLSDLSWPELPDLPDLSSLKWPDLPELPDLSALSWPELPSGVQQAVDFFERRNRGGRSGGGDGGLQRSPGAGGGTQTPSTGQRPEIRIAGTEITVDQDRIVQDLRSELEPIITRELQGLERDIRNEFRKAGNLAGTR